MNQSFPKFTFEKNRTRIPHEIVGYDNYNIAKSKNIIFLSLMQHTSNALTDLSNSRSNKIKNPLNSGFNWIYIFLSSFTEI